MFINVNSIIEDKDVYINIMDISSFHKYKDGTEIVLKDDTIFRVKERPEEVLSKIEGEHYDLICMLANRLRT